MRTSSRWARTSSRTSSLPARLPAASTSAIAPDAAFFPQPEGLLGDAPLLLGLDGQKMSKSRGNAIALAADDDETSAADPECKDRLQNGASRMSPRADPRWRTCSRSLPSAKSDHHERSPTSSATAARPRSSSSSPMRSTSASEPIRARRKDVAKERDYLRSILRAGNERARGIAADTLAAVHHLMHMDYSPISAGAARASR